MTRGHQQNRIAAKRIPDSLSPSRHTDYPRNIAVGRTRTGLHPPRGRPDTLFKVRARELFGKKFIRIIEGAPVTSPPRMEPENRGIYTQSDSSKKSSRNIWSLAVVSVDQRY